MTASVSPEVIEEWRIEFEERRKAKHPQPCLDRDEQGIYVAMNTWLAWDYWLDARQSVVIELPKRALPQDDQHDSGYNYCIDHAIELIESQGYRAGGG